MLSPSSLVRYVGSRLLMLSTPSGLPAMVFASVALTRSVHDGRAVARIRARVALRSGRRVREDEDANASSGDAGGSGSTYWICCVAVS